MTAKVLPAPIERLNDARRRIHRAIDFIDENLDRDSTLAELADVACLSRFHFQRVYARLVGQTPGETMRSLRLRRARDRIVFDGCSLTEAANDAGFPTVASFARAYRREFDRDPAEIRMLPQPLPRPRPLDRFTIVDRTAQTLAAICWSDERAAMDPLTVDTQTYARYLAADAGAKLLAVYHDDFLTPYDRDFRCDLCFPLDRRKLPEAAASFATVVAPGGLHACVEQRGLLFDLVPYWQGFVEGTLAQSGWRLRPGPVLRWFFSDRAITPPSQRLAYLYIPVAPAVSH
ncbi:MAG: helix-turn-helix domain-containing protein [Reyranellaceae bacterium]